MSDTLKMPGREEWKLCVWHLEASLKALMDEAGGYDGELLLDFVLAVLGASQTEREGVYCERCGGLEVEYDGSVQH